MKNEYERYMRHTTIRLSPDEHKRIKHLCIDKHVTMRDILLTGLTIIESRKGAVKKSR